MTGGLAPVVRLRSGRATLALVAIPIGRAPLGACEKLDGEAVTTVFVFVGPILMPVDTLYALRWRGTTPTGFQVRHHPKSVALAYLRWFVAPLAMMIAFIASIVDQHGPAVLSAKAQLILAIMAVVWMALIFASGRTTGVKARQRRVMAMHLGHAAPPELLFDGSLRLALEELDKTWDGAIGRDPSYRTDGGEALAWRDLYPKDVPERLLPLYYTACRYEAVLVNRQVLLNRANLAWRRIEGLFPDFESLRNSTLTVTSAALAARTVQAPSE